MFEKDEQQWFLGENILFAGQNFGCWKILGTSTALIWLGKD